MSTLIRVLLLVSAWVLVLPDASGQSASTRIYDLPSNLSGAGECSAIRVVPDGNGSLIVIVPLSGGDPDGIRDAGLIQVLTLSQDGTVVREQRLTAEPPVADEYFGEGCSTDGQTLLVVVRSFGTIYVYERVGPDFSLF